ncbi:hypothetical protein B0H10DRAFT_1787091 [Mycena sp. CBHHK59/15]|nr:hypothetical protein B0H10DRAFT_1787091 [Mycena sp. CBHHK59/15]
MSISSLPPELYWSIIAQIPQDSLQQSILSLTRALPYAPIPLQPLFQRIVITRPEQALQLTRRLIKSDGDAVAHYVEQFSVRNEWTVDADVLVNLIRKLPKLRSLSLCIGTNFAPEHLATMFERHLADLEYLSLRFRPYVQRATYQQFLSGSYFDSTLACLARWPASFLPTLSIVQDPMDPAQAPTKAFAQPLVFFRLDSHLADLAQSAYLSSLTSLKLCIPSRQVARCIASSPISLPSLELLDLSTCNVVGTEISDVLLLRLSSLKHLILDGCAVLRGEYHPEDWAMLGKGCALVGVKRTKEREKKLRQAQLETAPVAPSERRGKRGRRGLSTATISLRASPPRESRVVGVVDTPTSNAMRKIRIYPASPALCSLATTLPPSIPLDKHDEIQQQFAKGWYEGLAQLGEVRSRLFQSSRLGSKLMRFALIEDEEFTESEDGLDGLVEVTEWEDKVDIKAPVLCLVGPGKSETHEADCAHSVAWEVWKEV